MNLFVDSPGWTALVLALGHSLWQGALISIGVFLALKWTPTRLSNLRYALAVGSLILLVLSWLATWTWLERRQATGPAAAWVAPTRASIEAPAYSPALESDAAQFDLPANRGLISAPTSVVAGQRLNSNWQAWAGLFWLAGAVLFQARLFALVGQARNWVRQGEPMVDATVQAGFARLLDRLGLRGQVTLLTSGRIAIPAAWGVIKPVILIPSSYLAGLSPAQLEAILAHELAHIRRHDFAVNLAQMAIEGWFFFNPFVWWINRLIRLEREVCCDALAVQATGQRIVYAHALTAVAEAGLDRWAPPEPCVAMGRERGQLIERLRRLLQPQGAAGPRLPLASVAGVLLLCGMGLFLLKVTTGVAFDVLSPAERVQRFAELRSEYPDYARERLDPASAEDLERITVRGVLRTEDGQPIPRDAWVQITSRAPRHTVGASTSPDADGRFAHEIRAGTVFLSTRVDGYAPAFAGPLDRPEAWENLELVVRPGFNATVRLLDQGGNPVRGARLSARHDFPANSWTAEVVSDADGRVLLEQVGSKPVALEVDADGFQTDSWKDLTLQPDQVLTWVLETAEPTGGVVVFADTGDPVPGAQIHLGRRTGDMPASSGKPQPGNFLAETDAAGRFELRSLRDDAHYYLLISGPNASGRVAGPIRAGAPDLRFELPQATVLTVRVDNVTDAHLDAQGRLALTYGTTFNYGDHSYGSGQRFHATPENSAAEFHVGPLWQQEAVFTVGDQTVEMSWQEIVTQTEPVVIDLAVIKQPPPEAEPLTRTLRLALRTAQGQAEPQGAVLIEFVRNSQIQRVPAEVIRGRTESELPVPTWVEVLPSPLVGYWFAPKRFELVPDPDPFEIELDLHPAGAIHGEVVGEDGQPANQLLISVIPIRPLPGGVASSLGLTVKSSTFSGDHMNLFMAGPLPFDGAYVICAYRGTSFVLSEPLPVNRAMPFHQIKLTLPQGIPVEGTVLRPDGTPFAREMVAFNFSPTAGHGFGGRTAMTDRQGHFSFPNVNPNVQGEYHVELKLTREFQPVRRQVIPGEPIAIRLETGLVIEGRVIDHASGVPLGEVEVYALHRAGAVERPWPGWFEAEARTDTDGRFQFSNLAPGQYTISSRGGRVPGGDPTRTAGSGNPVTLAIEPRVVARRP